MAGLSPLSDAQWDSLIAIAYTAEAKRAGIPPIDLSSSSQFAAFFYAVRTALMQQQTQLGYAVLTSRLANCVGPDVDSFLASFGFARLDATFAQGQVVCSTNSALAAQLVIPVGCIFSTLTGAQGNAVTYVVIADPSNASYSQALGGYVIPVSTNAGPASVSVTVRCLVAGTIGNAQPAQIVNIVAGPIMPTGIGSITNPAALALPAIDTETDAAAKARFQAKFAGGEDGGSVLSLLALVLGVQPGLTASVAENTYIDGTEKDGWNTVVVNLLGATTDTLQQLITSVQAAYDANRTAGIRRSVIGSTVTLANIAAHLVFASGADVTTGTNNAIASVTAYLNSIGLDPAGAPTTVSIAQLYRAIVVSTPPATTGGSNTLNADILDVQNLTLNGQAAELTAPFATQFAAGQITFD